MMETYTPAKERELLIKLFWPALIEQGLTIMIGIVSTMMVSNVGAYAVSGVNLVDQINFLVFSVFNALATGATVVIAQYIGASKADKAGD
ncbi:MAG: MATE family efflux transporter, partial [Eubacteriales bacterium]